LFQEGGCNQSPALFSIQFAERIALVAGALLIVALTFGSTLHQDWDVAGLQLIYAAVYFALLALRQYNLFSVDRAVSSTTNPIANNL
jgi:hypothetical protein